jgi:hypothetical protein
MALLHHHHTQKPLHGVSPPLLRTTTLDHLFTNGGLQVTPERCLWTNGLQTLLESNVLLREDFQIGGQKLAGTRMCPPPNSKVTQDGILDVEIGLIGAMNQLAGMMTSMWRIDIILLKTGHGSLRLHGNLRPGTSTSTSAVKMGNDPTHQKQNEGKRRPDDENGELLTIAI